MSSMLKFQLLTPRTYLQCSSAASKGSPCSKKRSDALCLRLDVVLHSCTAPRVLALTQDTHALAQRGDALQKRLDQEVLASGRFSRRQPCAHRSAARTGFLVFSEKKRCSSSAFADGRFLGSFCGPMGWVRAAGGPRDRYEGRACRHCATRSRKWRLKWWVPESASSWQEGQVSAPNQRRGGCAHRGRRVLQSHHENLHGRELCKGRMTVRELQQRDAQRPAAQGMSTPHARRPAGERTKCPPAGRSRWTAPSPPAPSCSPAGQRMLPASACRGAHQQGVPTNVWCALSPKLSKPEVATP